MIGDGKEFVNWSEKNGWAHLYLYDENGNKESNKLRTMAYQNKLTN